MKVLRTHLLVVLLSALGLLAVPQAQAQLGIAAGANFDRFSDIESQNYQATFDNATGFHVGLFYDLAVGPLALRPGLFYMDVGDVQPALAGDSTPNAESFDVSLIEVPIDARFRLMMLPLVQPYVLAGPSFRFASSGDDDFNEAMNDFSMAGNVGLGLEIGLPASTLRLFPEVRYAFGLSSFAEDFEFQGANIQIDDGTRLNNFMLRLGLTF